MKSWEVEYLGHRIRVENRIANEKLFVDGQLQDECLGLGAGRVRLVGRIKDGKGAGETIKVSLGGTFGIQCRIFIDDALVFSG